jgi:hypothetical protein
LGGRLTWAIVKLGQTERNKKVGLWVTGGGDKFFFLWGMMWGKSFFGKKTGGHNYL